MRRKSAEPAQKPKRAKNLLSTAVETLEERLRASGVTVTGLGEPLPPRKFIATFIPRKREAGQSRKESSHARGTLHDIEREVVKTLSSCKRAIPGFQRLSDDAASGDKVAVLVVCELAHVAITHLLGGIGSVDVFHTSPMGLFGEQFEPSLGIRIEAAKTKRAPVLATLAAFAKNFNQGEVHVQAAPKRGTKAGLRYTDGSFNTCRYQIKLGESLSRPDVVSLYQQSGLFGDTVSGDFMSAYFAADPGTIQEVERFTAQIERLYELVGENGRGVNREIVRLWRYGDGRKGTISLSTIRGEIHLPSAEGSRAARHIAARLANRQVMEAPALDVQSNSPSDNLTEEENSKSPLARMADRLNTHLRDSGYTVTEEPGALTPGEFVATFIPRKRKKTDRKTKKKLDR